MLKKISTTNFFVAFFMVVVAYDVYGQTLKDRRNLTTVVKEDTRPTFAKHCKNDHASEWEFFMGENEPTNSEGERQGVGVLPPVTVLGFSGATLNWAYFGSREVRLGSLEIHPEVSAIKPKANTKFDTNNHKGCYAITFCKKHLIVLTLETLEKRECKKLK